MTTLGTTTSPILFTPAVRARFDRMRIEDHPVWAKLIEVAAPDVSNKVVYGNEGVAAMVVYAVTGDPQYAEYCAATIGDAVFDSTTLTDANAVRQIFVETVVKRFVTWPALTPAHQAAALQQLTGLCDYALAIGMKPYQGGERIGDTDQNIAQYMGMALTETLFPSLGTWLDKTSNSGVGASVLIGGLDSTDPATLRSALRSYVTDSAGGDWVVESSDYSTNDDTSILLLGWLVLRQALGVDHFPEVAAWLPQWALSLIDDVLNLQNRMCFGDEEHPGDIRLWDRYPALALVHQCLVEIGDTKTAGWIAFHLDELVQKYGFGYPSTPAPAFVLCYDPYAEKIDYHGQIPRTHYSSGIGRVVRHDGGECIAAFTPSPAGVDHDMAYVGDVQIWDTDEFALWHPHGYAVEQNGDCCNVPLYAGMGSMIGRACLGIQDADDFLASFGMTTGPVYGPGFYNPPHPFVREGTRASIYLPALKALVVCDRMDLDDPKTQPNFDRYQPNAAASINGAAHLKQVQWHFQGPPANTVLTATGAISKTPLGKPLRLDAFSTGGPVSFEQDDIAKVLGPGGFNPSELVGARVRIGSDRTGPECIVSCYQWGANQVVPLPVIGNPLGFQIGDTLVLFSVSGSMPAIIPPKSVGTDYLIGTDAAGRWGVTTQSGSPVVVPTPLPAPTPPTPAVLPSLVVGQVYLFPDGTKKVFEMIPGFADAP